MSKPDLIIIGAGPAGLLAAITASKNGMRCTVYEKMDRPCRKLSITGKGRCNISNDAPLSQFRRMFRSDNKFIRKVFSQFFTPQLIQMFENDGIEFSTERGGRIFPKSNQAKDIVSSLIRQCNKLGIEIKTGYRAIDISIENNSIQTVSVAAIKNGEKRIIKIKNIIIATGGISYPATGSTGDGYSLAKKAGHSIMQPAPALVPLVTRDMPCGSASDLQGVSLKNVTASLWGNDKKIEEQQGEMLFTHFGFSGPIILTLSRKAVELTSKGEKCSIIIDLKPGLNHEKLDKRLLREFKDGHKKKFGTLLKSLLTSKMVPFCAKSLNISLDKPVFNLSKKDRKKLRIWLKNLTFEIKGPRPLKEAIVTAGGISTKEVNASTMESKFCKGLFFAGETLDIDADTGGYNLQAAFSTGFIAGKHIKKDV